MRPYDENENMTLDEFDEITEIEEIVEDTPIEELDEDTPEAADVLIGNVARCTRLNVRFKPNVKSDVVCEIEKNTEVMIDESESTDEFYKIYMSSGIEGYCMKKYIDIQP